MSTAQLELYSENRELFDKLVDERVAESQAEYPTMDPMLLLCSKKESPLNLQGKTVK